MSASLTWKPAKGGTRLPDALKFALRERSGWSFPRTIDGGDRDFFEGLAAADVAGAQAVIDLIDQHQQIELHLEY